MKSGYYTYNNEKYRFELDDEHITVVNENGVNWKSLWIILMKNMKKLIIYKY